MGACCGGCGGSVSCVSCGVGVGMAEVSFEMGSEKLQIGCSCRGLVRCHVSYLLFD